MYDEFEVWELYTIHNPPPPPNRWGWLRRLWNGFLSALAFVAGLIIAALVLHALAS